MHFRSHAVCACLALALALPGRAEEPLLASINGQTISVAEFHAELERRAGTQVLGDLLLRRMVLSQAKADDCLPSPAELDAEWVRLRTERFGGDEAKLRAALKQSGLDEAGLRQEMTLHLAQNKLCLKGVAQDEATLHKFFIQRHAELFDKPARLSFRQMNLPTKDAAVAAAKAIKGGKSFDEVAQTQGNAGPGGPNTLVEELPLEQIKKMAPPLAEALGKLAPNELNAEPVAFNDGFWLVQLAKRLPSEPATYTDPATRAAVKERYLSLNSKKPQQLMTELQQAAKVQVSDPRFKADVEARFGPNARPAAPGGDD